VRTNELVFSCSGASSAPSSSSCISYHLQPPPTHGRPCALVPEQARKQDAVSKHASKRQCVRGEASAAAEERPTRAADTRKHSTHERGAAKRKAPDTTNHKTPRQASASPCRHRARGWEALGRGCAGCPRIAPRVSGIGTAKPPPAFASCSRPNRSHTTAPHRLCSRHQPSPSPPPSSSPVSRGNCQRDTSHLSASVRCVGSVGSVCEVCGQRGIATDLVFVFFEVQRFRGT
jgi:hypothetical protein